MKRILKMFIVTCLLVGIVSLPVAATPAKENGEYTRFSVGLSEKEVKKLQNNSRIKLIYLI